MRKYLPKIKFILLIGAVALISLGANQGQASDDNQWQILFDGTNLDQWKGYNTDTIDQQWQIEGDALYFNPKVLGTGGGSGGDIVSKDQYGDFELNLEWKVASGSNSGIFYHAVEDEKFSNVYYNAPEMQVVDNIGHADGHIVKHKAGDLYDMIASSVDASNPVGQWNTVRIIVKDNVLEHWLNGQMVVRTTLWDDNWAALIANSKFANWPGFGQNKVGHIALQDHGDPVWYRNIKIKKLD